MSENNNKKKNNNKDENVPDKLKIYVSQEIWSSWSSIRRESFQQIIKNPNAFFYRNRPPGDPQKNGPFSKEEEEQFLNRLNYFRDILQIEDGLWGLFSVPIKGRLGYQCSNFYRLLIKENKIKDPHYEIVDGKLIFKHGQKKSVDPGSIEILEKEAFDFINKCLTENGENPPQVLKPINIKPPNLEKSKNIIEEKIKDPEIQLLNSFIGYSRGLKDRNISTLEALNITNGGKNPNKKDKKIFFNDEENYCPLVGALDPITKEPMKNPTINQNGYVLDLSTWKDFIKKGFSPFDNDLLLNEKDLIELNSKNYFHFKYLINNISF